LAINSHFGAKKPKILGCLPKALGSEPKTLGYVG